MGFFSDKCLGCDKSILSPYVVTSTNDWMMQAVVITPDDQVIKGEYDGYGTVGNYEDAIGEGNSVYHAACWRLAGSPTTFQGSSDGAEDQGYFYNDEDYDIPEPAAPAAPAPNAVVVVIEGGVVQGVYSADGGPLATPVVVIDYDDDAAREDGVEFIPQGDKYPDAPAWVTRWTSAEKLNEWITPWAVVV